MGEVFRIIDCFNITGRGRVYLIKNPLQAIIRVGDMLYDFRHNGFRVVAIDIGRNMSDEIELRETPVGLVLEPLGGAEAEGNLLIRDFNDINFIFCKQERSDVQETIQHLMALGDRDVELTQEVNVNMPKGTPANTVRAVSENCRALKIIDFEFDDGGQTAWKMM